MGDHGQLGGRLEEIILKRLSEDRLVVPPLGQTATTCLALLRSAEPDLRKVWSALERDPVLSAQILRLANSAAYGPSVSSSLATAVTRLGAKKLTTVVTSAAAHAVFESRDPSISGSFKTVWRHSVAVALMSRDLAVLVGEVDPDSAYLGGLLHDVGKPVMATMLLEAERSLTSQRGVEWIKSEAWTELVHQYHRKIGGAVAAAWQLPEGVQQTIKEPSEYDAQSRLSVQNVVRFSNAVAKREGLHSGNPADDDSEVLIMIGRSMLKLEDSGIARLTRGLRDRVHALWE